MGSGGDESEGEGNSLISQTVAMAIAGTSTASPMSRPSSFLLNSQVRPHGSFCVVKKKKKRKAVVTTSHYLCLLFGLFLPLLIPPGRISSGESSARQLLGRVQPQPSYLSAVGPEKC